MQQIKSIYIYIALAFVGCLPSYHLWKKTPWLGVFPHQQTTKGSSLGPALKLSAVHDLSEKLEEDLKQVPSHLSKDEDKSNVWLLWYKVIYIVIYVYIYMYWIWLNLTSKLKRSTSKARERFVDEITAICCALKKLPMVMKEERHGRQYICKNFS